MARNAEAQESNKKPQQTTSSGKRGTGKQNPKKLGPVEVSGGAADIGGGAQIEPGGEKP